MSSWEEWKELLYVDGKVRKEYDESIMINLDELDIKLLMFLNGEIEWKEVEEDINFIKYRFNRIRNGK